MLIYNPDGKTSQPEGGKSLEFQRRIQQLRTGTAKEEAERGHTQLANQILSETESHGPPSPSTVLEATGKTLEASLQEVHSALFSLLTDGKMDDVFINMQLRRVTEMMGKVGMQLPNVNKLPIDSPNTEEIDHNTMILGYPAAELEDAA